MSPARGKEILDAIQLEDALADLHDWELKTGKIERTFHTKNFMAGLDFIQLLAPLAEEANHHPDVILTFPKVKVQLVTHDVGGITNLDIDLAKRINDLADTEGIV